MYKIYGLDLGEKDNETARMLPGFEKQFHTVPGAWFMWCVKGPNVTFLVDTGMIDSEVKGRELTNVTPPATLLKRINVDPASITTVLVTHLHTDHFSAYDLYPKANFYVQKRDIDFYAGPAIRFRQINRRAINMADLWKFIRADRVRVLDGDEQIMPGVRVVLLGGHTPGSQAVIISTSKGDAVLCADVVDLYKNLEEGVVGASSMDMQENLLALDKVRRLTATPELIIPGHDALVMKKFKTVAENIIEIG